MPELDPETLLRSSSDSKIGIETRTESSPPPDYAAESFYLSKDDELDWLDRNAAFYERNESTKGNSHPISTSQRYSSAFNVKSKASIILGLPKNKATNYADVKSRRYCRPVNNTARFFPKRSRSSGKSNLPLSEPGSPKVSCIGRVKSKRGDHRRSRRGIRQKPITPMDIDVKPVVRPKPVVRTGFWKTLKSAFGVGRRKTRAADEDKPPPTTKAMTESVVAEPPGLGGLNRFASGRKTESWDLDVGSESDSSDHGSVWRRRGVGPPKLVDCNREWTMVGPSSV